MKTRIVQLANKTWVAQRTGPIFFWRWVTISCSGSLWVDTRFGQEDSKEWANRTLQDYLAKRGELYVPSSPQ